MTVTLLDNAQRESRPGAPVQLDLESVYRENFGAITAFFARRCREPQQVADLTSETFVEAIKSAHTFRGYGSARAWLFAIARRVYARQLAGASAAAALVDRVGSQLVLDEDEIEDLADRIDAEREGRELLAAAAMLPTRQREALELVDLAGLTTAEAAQALGVPAGTLRVRLFRAHTKLRRKLNDDRI